MQRAFRNATFKERALAMASCENVYEQWCPTAICLRGGELAEHCADQHGLPGRVLNLDEASDLATEAWSDVI